jgi:hypothetical protein
MARRWAIVIGVAAAGVMALGAQAATSSTVESVDSSPPDLQLSGNKRQHALSGRKLKIGAPVRVKASCGDEECTARAKGKLTKVQKDKLKPWTGERLVAPGKKISLYLGMTKESQREVRKAVDEGKKVKAKVTVRATDAAGNVATAKRTIELVK